MLPKVAVASMSGASAGSMAWGQPLVCCCTRGAAGGEGRKAVYGRNDHHVVRKRRRHILSTWHIVSARLPAKKNRSILTSIEHESASTTRRPIPWPTNTCIYSEYCNMGKGFSYSGDIQQFLASRTPSGRSGSSQKAILLPWREDEVKLR